MSLLSTKVEDTGALKQVKAGMQPGEAGQDAVALNQALNQEIALLKQDLRQARDALVKVLFWRFPCNLSCWYPVYAV